MARPGINSTVESEQQPYHRDVCTYDHDHRPQLIRPMHFRGKRRRDTQTEPLRRLMAAVLSEGVNRFQRNLFHTSLYGRCEFVEAEFWLFRDQNKALFSFNNVCDFLSLDPQHIRQQLRDWRRTQVQATNSTDATTRTPTNDLNDGRRSRIKEFYDSDLLHKILCPVDFDDNSMTALETACKVATQNDASLCVMHVVAIPAHATEMPPEALKPYPIWERDAKLKLDHLASLRIPREIRSETLTRSGFPAAEITAAAKDSNVDLIVMATHGRSRPALEHFFLGSVAERVVRRSVCPVLVVPLSSF